MLGRPLSDARSDAPLWVRTIHAMLRGYCRYWHTAQMATSTLPDRGPAILICNHISVLDPILLVASNKRLISFMIAQEYYDIPAIQPVLRATGCIPVRRNGHDRAALRQALAMLKAGRALGVFPEGGIGRDGDFRAGVAWLIQQTRAPVVSARVSDAYQYDADWRTYVSRQRPRLHYGAPQHFHADLDREGIMSQLQAAMMAL